MEDVRQYLARRLDECARMCVLACVKEGGRRAKVEEQQCAQYARTTRCPGWRMVCRMPHLRCTADRPVRFVLLPFVLSSCPRVLVFLQSPCPLAFPPPVQNDWFGIPDCTSHLFLSLTHTHFLSHFLSLPSLPFLSFLSLRKPGAGSKSLRAVTLSNGKQKFSLPVLKNVLSPRRNSYTDFRKFVYPSANSFPASPLPGVSSFLRGAEACDLSTEG